MPPDAPVLLSRLEAPALLGVIDRFAASMSDTLANLGIPASVAARLVELSLAEAAVAPAPELVVIHGGRP